MNTSAPRENPRDAYLAWQAEIGTEDVVLVQPWVKPRPAGPATSGFTAALGSHNAASAREARDPVSHRSPNAGNPPPGNPFAPASGADFFQSIAESLAKPDPYVKKRKSESTPAPAPQIPPAAFAISFPEHRDLSGYWATLDASHPIWFPGSSPTLARAEGSPRAPLAVVELSPTGPNGESVFGGESGEFLDKMMKGIGLSRDNLYLTSVMKTAASSKNPAKAWARKDIARMVPALLQELRLAECGLVLLMGEACAQGVLRTGKNLAALAETAESQGNMTLVATEHPAQLMHAEDAARRAAWNQLKWLRARLPSSNA